MVKVVQTVRDTADRLTPKSSVAFSTSNPDEELNLINIHPEVHYQQIIGFGSALTEASAVTLYKLKPAVQRKVMEMFFHPTRGLNYTLCRTHINSCDFSTGNYAYVDDPKDIAFKTFSLARDKQALFPMIKEALKISGNQLKLFASPWSPPGWMKTTGIMNQGGKLLPAHRGTWARYIARYLKECAKEGIKIWGITVQNEPKATQTWDSCIYTAEEERDFVAKHLGPVLKKSGLSAVKIIIWDHNKERIVERAKTILSNKAARNYIYGIGFHWYSGDHFDALTMTHQQWPDKKILFTEGCMSPATMGSWQAGEHYGHNIIGDLNNWTESWTEWNFILDEKGGPNHVGNFCNAPVIANTRTSKLSIQSSYYYIGHFSKFILPGSRRIGSSVYTDKLEVTAWRAPQGTITVVVLNRTDEKLPFRLRCEHGIAKMNSGPHSIMTLQY